MIGNIWNEHVDKMISVGRSLVHLGVNNYALSYDDSLLVLAQFAAEGIAVLGGDVYIIKNESIESACDSWHCDQGNFESDKVFLIRSIRASRGYIQSYSLPIDLQVVRFRSIHCSGSVILPRSAIELPEPNHLKVYNALFALVPNL